MLFRGTAIVSALTLLSRLLGFFRDLLVARLLGASLFADAFFVAFRIPNLLRSFVAEGALTSAFTPVFSAALTRGKKSASDTCRRITGFLLLMTGTLTILIILGAPQVVQILAPGFMADSTKFDLCVTLTRIMAPYLACVSLIAMLNAALNTLGIFGTSAWAQVIMNGVLIIGAFCAIPFDLSSATILLAASVLLGGIVQILTQMPTCRRAGLSLRPSTSLYGDDVRDVIRLMIPATLGASIYQITIFVATLLASLLPSGSVSWLFYADRVAQFPIGIFSIALASVLLPALSNASARADTNTFNRNLSDSLRFTSFFIIPMAAGIWALALPITQLLFERGAFTHESSLKTSQALQALCIGLWASSCHSMLVRAFIARRDTVTPSLIGACSLLINICLSLLLIGPLDLNDHSNSFVRLIGNLQISLLYAFPSTAKLGHVGLAMASSVAAFGSLFLVITMFALRMRPFSWRPFLSSSSKALISATLMIVAIQFTERYWSQPAMKCAAGAIVGAIVFLGTSFLSRSEELRDAIDALKNRAIRLSSRP